jgi:hypothetical protein
VCYFVLSLFHLISPRLATTPFPYSISILDSTPFDVEEIATAFHLASHNVSISSLSYISSVQIFSTPPSLPPLSKIQQNLYSSLILSRQILDYAHLIFFVQDTRRPWNRIDRTIPRPLIFITFIPFASLKITFCPRKGTYTTIHAILHCATQQTRLLDATFISAIFELHFSYSPYATTLHITKQGTRQIDCSN